MGTKSTLGRVAKARLAAQRARSSEERAYALWQLADELLAADSPEEAVTQARRSADIYARQGRGQDAAAALDVALRAHVLRDDENAFDVDLRSVLESLAAWQQGKDERAARAVAAINRAAFWRSSRMLRYETAAVVFAGAGDMHAVHALRLDQAELASADGDVDIALAYAEAGHGAAKKCHQKCEVNAAQRVVECAWLCRREGDFAHLEAGVIYRANAATSDDARKLYAQAQADAEATGDASLAATVVWGEARLAEVEGRDDLAEAQYEAALDAAIESGHTHAVVTVARILLDRWNGRHNATDAVRIPQLEDRINSYVSDLDQHHDDQPDSLVEALNKWRLYAAYRVHRRERKNDVVAMAALLQGVARWHMARLRFQDPRARAAAAAPYAAALGYALHVAKSQGDQLLLAELISLSDFAATYTASQVLRAGDKVLGNNLVVLPAPVLVMNNESRLAKALRHEGYDGPFATFYDYLTKISSSHRPLWWLLHSDNNASTLYWSVVEADRKMGFLGTVVAGALHACSSGRLAAFDELQRTIPVSGRMDLQQRAAVLNGPLMRDPRREHLLLKELGTSLVPRPLIRLVRKRNGASPHVLVSLPRSLARLPIEALIVARDDRLNPAPDGRACPAVHTGAERRRLPEVDRKDRRLCELAFISAAPNAAVLARSTSNPSRRGSYLAVVDPLNDLPSARASWDGVKSDWSIIQGSAATASEVRKALTEQPVRAFFYSGHLQQVHRAGVDFSALRLADGPVDLVDMSAWFGIDRPGPETVVLSGCSSLAGHARSAHGEGLNLVGPLIQSGARTVLATRWHLVDSGAAASLERRLRAAAANGRVAAELRRAQIECASSWRELALAGAMLPSAAVAPDIQRPLIVFAYTSTLSDQEI